MLEIIHWGMLREQPRDPRHGLGGPYTRKKFRGTQLQIHTRFTPPSPEKGVPRCGGGTGVKIQKIIGGSFVVLK